MSDGDSSWEMQWHQQAFCRVFVLSLKGDVSIKVTQIFFRKLSVLFHNSDVLRSMAGQFVTLEAIDEGDTKGIQRSLWWNQGVKSCHCGMLACLSPLGLNLTGV